VPVAGELNILIDVIASGSVLGLGVGDTPDQVAGRLGDAFLEDATRSTMRRDYGLIEFFWRRGAAGDPWMSAGFTVKVHRLAVKRDLADGPWARLGPRVPFAGLSAELARLGVHCAEITIEADRPDWRRYWHAEALVSVQVTRAAWRGALKAGDVFAIHVPHTAATVAADQLRGRYQVIRDGLEQLLRLDEAGRQAWLDWRQPAPADRLFWWLYLLLVVDGRLRDRPPGRARWITLRIWLLRQALARGVFSPARHAEDMCYFVLAMRLAGADPASLPSADDVVAACLDAIPVRPRQAIARDDAGGLVTLDPAVLDPSRQVRFLVSAAQWHLDALADQELASRLHEWMAIRHLLV
jgi:hypothetical protein